MTDSSHAPPADVTQTLSDPGPDLVQSALMVASGFGSLLVWLLPQAKPEAVLGRLSYWQFSLACLLTAMFCSLALVVFSSNRRARGFRVTALWLGMLVGLVISESLALLLPPDSMKDNPWYAATSQADEMMDGSDQLMFVRPPHLKWQGMSRGDFAIPYDLEDPYARSVTFQTDFEGFRNSVDIRQAAVIFIGDSFTEAGNVPEEETFVGRIGDALELPVRNLGRASHGPSSELIILRKYGLPCQPRLVVWQFYEDNDLDDEVEFQDWIDVGRPPHPEQEELTRLDVWQQRSPSYYLFNRLRRRKAWPYGGRFHDAKGASHSVLFLGPPTDSSRPSGHAGWPLMVSSLRTGAELLRQSDVALLVVLIPIKMRVMGHYVEFNEATRAVLHPNWDLRPEQTMARHLQELCQSLDVRFIDATPCLKKRAEAGELVYLPLDTHLSSQGHAAVANLIVNAVREGVETRQ